MCLFFHFQGNSTQPQQPQTRPKPPACNSKCRKTREQANTDHAYDSDDEDSDDELASKLGPIILKAVRQLSKTTGSVQTNGTRPRRWRARVITELQKEKESELHDDRTEFLVSLITTEVRSLLTIV